MRWATILSLALALALLACCFLPWVTIESKNIVVTGVQAEGTSFGKPGYLHIVFIVIYCVLVLLGKVWSIRVAIIICALNIAWALRNFLLIATCYMGECPVKHPALYLLLVLSISMLITAAFVPRLPKQEQEEAT